MLDSAEYTELGPGGCNMIVEEDPASRYQCACLHIKFMFNKCKPCHIVLYIIK